MTWWQIALLCYFTFWLGRVNATVMERERYYIWMANSWELINRRLWWIKMSQQKKPEDVTLQDLAEIIPNMSRTLNDYNDIFGRPYVKEELLSHEPDVVAVDE